MCVVLFAIYPPIMTDLDSKSMLMSLCKNYKNLMKVIHLNAQSLTYDCHVNEFTHLFDSCDIDVIAVSETFYKSNADIVPLSGFNVFTSNRTSHDGGGVAVYIKSSYQCRVITQSVSPMFRQQQPDFIILEVSLSNAKLLFACIYRPPKAGHLGDFEEALFPLCAEYQYVVVAGDVNAHFGSSLPCDINDSKHIFQLLEICNLSLVPFAATYHTATCDSSLDMISSACPDKLLHFSQFPACGLSAHDIIAAVFNFYSIKHTRITYTRRDFTNFNVEEFRKDVREAPWEGLLHMNDVNDKVAYFNETLIALFDKHAPIKTFTRKSQPKPWFNVEINATIKSRDIALRRYRRSKCAHDLTNYKIFRNRAKTLIRNAKVRHAYSLFGNNCNNPRQLWQSLRNLNVSKTSVQSCTFPPAKDLNAHYTSVPVTDVNAIRNTKDAYDQIPPAINDLFAFKYVYFEDLLKVVKSLKSNAKGVDSITTAMLKCCIFELSPALLHIFNFSLQHGVFPDLWKIASVKPLPKVTNASELKQFRPISILCTLSKLLEKIVHAQLTEFLISNNLLSPHQSGFRAGYSTTTALLKVVGDVREAIGRRQLTLLVLYDFSNAFPSVNPDLQISKLKCLGISSPALAWFKSYLTDRQQFVNTGISISQLAYVLLGVPQGSVLGPLLYTLYVNDISSIFSSSNFHLYADDLQNYYHFCPEDYQKAIDIINNEAAKLLHYATCHNLAINEKKTQVIIVGNPKLLNKLPNVVPSVCINGTCLPFKTSVVNLGITLDHHLTWEPYATSICKKSIASLQQIRRHRHLLPTPVRKRLVESLIFPIFDYGSIVTEGMLIVCVNRIQRIQNACVRFVLGLHKYCHITQYYNELKWLRIQHRRKYLAVSLLKNVLFYRSPGYIHEKLEFVNTIHSRSLRNNYTLRVPHHRTDKQRGAFWIYAVVLWNLLPSYISTCKSIHVFKCKARNYFLNDSCV